MHLTRLIQSTTGFAVLLLVLLAACNDDTTGPIDPRDLTFHASLGVDLDAMTLSASGLYLQDEEVGQGTEAVAGSSVDVFYTGWLHTGLQFDSNVGGDAHNIPSLGATTGTGAVIEGWNEGLLGMRPGGRRLLVIPSDLAYGPFALGPIPPYSTLVFRVEVVAVTP